MGLFERTKHLERLAREIADQNLRQLGSKETVVDKEETRRQLLEMEAVLREYRLHLEEEEARRELAAGREKAARDQAARWLENAALAREKKRGELAEQATQRASVFEREHEQARADADHPASTIARLRAEIADVERRIAVLRALRKGEPAQLPPPAPGARGPATTRLSVGRRDPLEEAFEKLKDEG